MTITPIQTEPELVDDTSSVTLASLARNINQWETDARDLADAWLAKAVRIGNALISAQRLVERGKWTDWCSENLTITYYAANKYVRVAAFAEELDGATSIVHAHAILRQKNLVLRPGVAVGRKEMRPEMESHVRQLASDGLSQRSIAEMTGLSRDEVRKVVAPRSQMQMARDRNRRYRERGRERRAEQAALLEKRRAEELRATVAAGPKDLSSAYGQIRKALTLLDRSLAESSPEVRNATRMAIDNLHRAEGNCVEAIRGSRARD